MHLVKSTLALCLCLILSGHAMSGEAYDALHRLYPLPQTLSLTAVPVCMRHGCEHVEIVPISPTNWQRVRKVFNKPAQDAAKERARIARALGILEQITGRLAGTAGDKAGNLASVLTSNPQLDCIDESTNSTTYLTLLEQQDLLHWHRIGDIVHRGFLLFGGWPHFSATVVENQGGKTWVVDSWFRDNGEPADIVELDAWKAGWRPARTAQ